MAVYCLHKNHKPHPQDIYEVLTYIDKDDTKWEMIRFKKGMLISCVGDNIPEYFDIDDIGLKRRKINNTNNIYFTDTTFELFLQVRDLIPVVSTESFWETIGQLIMCRLHTEDKLIKSEMVERNTNVNIIDDDDEQGIC